VPITLLSFTPAALQSRISRPLKLTDSIPDSTRTGASLGLTYTFCAALRRHLLLEPGFRPTPTTSQRAFIRHRQPSVLYGPQGTLFGSAMMPGALLFEPNTL